MTMEDLTDLGLVEYIEGLVGELLENCDSDDEPVYTYLFNTVLASQILHERMTKGETS